MWYFIVGVVVGGAAVGIFAWRNRTKAEQIGAAVSAAADKVTAEVQAATIDSSQS